MPRNKSRKAPSDAVGAAPPVHEISTSQVRELLDAVKRSPAGMVQQVGSLFRLFVSVVEAKLPSVSAPSATSIKGYAAATPPHGNTIVTKEEKEQADKIVVRARATRARGRSLADEGKKEKAIAKGEPKDKVKALRYWAARCSRRVPRLMDLLEATPEIGIDDALLVQHQAERIAPREAGKALSAAAAALAYVTRVSGDVLAKASAQATATNIVRAERGDLNDLQISCHHGPHADHRPLEDVIPADVAAGEARTAAIRVQAFVRGVIGRSAFRADNSAATLGQTCGRARRQRHETACRLIAAATVEIQPAAATVVQAFWRGVRVRDALFCRTVAAVIVQRWRRSTIVLGHLARARVHAQEHGANVMYFATVCLEVRFISICKTSVSMSAYSPVYRTASTLLQRRWMKTVKNAYLLACRQDFDEAEMCLRSLIRRQSQQAELDGVVNAFNANQLATTSPKTARLSFADEAWLVAAEALLQVEHSRSWGTFNREMIKDTCANDTNYVARERAAVGTKATSHSPGLVEGAAEAEESSLQGTRSSTDYGDTVESGIAAGSTDSKASTSISQAFKPEADSTSNNRPKRSKEGRRAGDNSGQGSDRFDSSTTDQQVALFAHNSNTTLTAKAPLSAASGRRNVARVGGQLPTIKSRVVTTPRRNMQEGLCTSHERPQTTRESAAEEPSPLIRAMPSTRQVLPASQLRVLLNALMHTPVGVVQQVGLLLVLFVSVVEASNPTSGALPAGSIVGRAAATAADGSIIATKEEQERATRIVSAAKAKRARGNRLTGEGGKAPAKDVPIVRMETLRRWAARRNQKVQRLLRLLQETKEIGVDDALLIRYHAEGIVPREAAKALSAAAAVLSYVTRVSGDAIAKSHAGTITTEGVVEEIHVNIPVQESHHHGANAEQEILPVDAATAGMCTAVIRVQALARGVVARRAFRAATVESGNMCSTSPVATCIEMVNEASLVAAKALSKPEQSLTCGSGDRQINGDCSSSDRTCVAGKRSSSLDSDTESGGSSNKESCSLSDKDSPSTLLGDALVEPDSTLSVQAKSKDLSRIGVSSEEGNEPLKISPTNTSEDLVTQQVIITSAMDATMALPCRRNRVVKVGGPPPTLQQAMVTFDEAFVWPVASSVKADEATVASADELPYGGGQIIGHHGEVISSKAHGVSSRSLLQTPTPRRAELSEETSPPETPTSPSDRPCLPTSPSTPSPRRRRRREGVRTSPGRLRSRSTSLSLFRVSTATGRSQEAFSTSPSSPDRLRTTDSVATSSCVGPEVDSATKAEDSSQAGRIASVVDSAAKTEEGSSQEQVETPASDLFGSCIPAAKVGSASRDITVRPRMRWGLEGTYQPRRRPSLSRTAGPARLPVAQFRHTVCAQSKLQEEQFVPESDEESDDESDDESGVPPIVGTAGRLHGKNVNGWRQDGDEFLETGIFPPARFLQFRTCPRYWCYQDYVLSEQEMKMCASFPAVLVGGGAGVLIADVVEEHGRLAMELAIERSVRNAFNGGSRYNQQWCKSSEEMKTDRNGLALSSGSTTAAGADNATTAGAGQGTIAAEGMPNADAGPRHGGASLDTRAVNGDWVLAAQCRTSLKEQERALEQCRARFCSASGSETNTKLGDSELAALYRTSLREQEDFLALCSGRHSSGVLGTEPKPRRKPGKG